MDADLGEHAVVEYAIVDGNDQKIFRVDSLDSVGVIRTVSRLDRESMPADIGTPGVFLLTLKCFRPYQRKIKSDHKKYDPSVRHSVLFLNHFW